MDTCKIDPRLYQYTSVDDCTRYRVLHLYSRRTAANTLDLIAAVTEEMPIPIQLIQTAKGLEFSAIKVREKLMELSTKFRQNKPCSPHLDGKVARLQKRDETDFIQPFRRNQRTLMTYWRSGDTDKTGAVVTERTKTKLQCNGI